MSTSILGSSVHHAFRLSPSFESPPRDEAGEGPSQRPLLTSPASSTMPKGSWSVPSLPKSTTPRTTMATSLELDFASMWSFSLGKYAKNSPPFPGCSVGSGFS